MLSSVAGGQRHAPRALDQPRDEARGDVEVEAAVEAVVERAARRDCCETAIAGSPSTTPSSAAATVPE